MRRREFMIKGVAWGIADRRLLVVAFSAGGDGGRYLAHLSM